MSSKPAHTRGLYAFELVHPAVQLGWFAAILILTMASIQPVLLCISFVCALAFSIYARGLRPSLQTLAWQLPLIALIALVNPLFSPMGSTELFRIGTQAIYLESFVFGACMGVMLVSVMLWFSNAAQVLSSDKVLAVFGNRAPTIGLIISMTMRLVPQFVERGGYIGDTAKACTAAAPQGAKENMAGRVRLISVLMGWSMEDSLETADAMRARGWGASRKRTSYRRHRFRGFDAGAAVLLVLLAAGCAFLAWTACSQYHFYPTMSILVPWWGYIPYFLFMILPLAACLADDLRWRRLS